MLVTEYEDTEPLFRVQHNESDSESSWDEDLGDGQVEVEIYEDKDVCFIEGDELLENITESRCTTDSEQTFLKNIDGRLDSDQTLVKNIDHRLHEDVSPEGTFVCPPLISVNETDSLSIYANEKCNDNNRDQIALYGEALTGDNNEWSSESNQESSDENNNNGNTNHYEKLGDNSDDHHYTLPPPPPVIVAISEEMEEESITAEQVIEISRANTHNNEDDDDNNTESPVTNYVSGETSPP